MFRLNHNLLSVNAQRNLFNTSLDISKRIERLSSGVRIIRPSDDAAGMSASEAMRAQLVGQKASSANIDRARALINTADSGLGEIGNMYSRLKELAIQAADGTLNNNNRLAISAEAGALISEIQRISNSTVFNAMTLIASAAGQAFTFFVGDGTTNIPINYQRMTAIIQGVTIATSGIGSIGTFSSAITVAYFGSQSAADLLVTAADAAVNAVAAARTSMGAFNNQLDRAQDNLSAAIINTTFSESVIRDADFAMEGSALTRARI
ncbi:MAG: flagellin, partial [Candidatus Poribacteria bacterium]|nr:flagellin [Candidatus Poribacteria bacterium]